MRRFWQIVIVLGVCFSPALAPAAEPKRVLVLQSYGRNFSPWDEFTRSFRAELDQRSSTPIEYYDASITSERFNSDQEEVPLLNYLQAIFENRQIDLVVPLGAPAARFVQRHRLRFFPSTPVLFAAVDQRRLSVIAPDANDSVVAMSIDFASVAQNILRVLPKTENIFVVSGNTPNQRFWAEYMREVVQPNTSHISFTWFNDLPFYEMLKRVATLPPNSAIFFFALGTDATGMSHEGDNPFIRLRKAANAPIFAYLDTHFGKGIVGGSLISVTDTAQRTAGVAERILSGEPASGIKTELVGHGIPKFDWRELQRWDISESRLPPGSEIHFRPPGIWQQYRQELIAILIVVLIQASLIVWLLFERGRRRRVEVELRSRLLEVTHLNRTAVAGALSASFSHELNQPLAAILSNADAADILLLENSPNVGQLTEIVSEIRLADQHAAEIIKRLGGLMKKNRPVDLETFNLNDAVRGALNLIDAEATNRGVILGVSQAQVALPVRADVVHLQQVILNLALNAMDAMLGCAPGSRKITLETALVGQSEAEGSVADTGMGIPTARLKDVFDTFFTTKPNGTGLGLSIARTIIETYVGRIWSENKIGGGAVFRFTLPIAKAQAI